MLGPTDRLTTPLTTTSTTSRTTLPRTTLRTSLSINPSLIKPRLTSFLDPKPIPKRTDTTDLLGKLSSLRIAKFNTKSLLTSTSSTRLSLNISTSTSTTKSPLKAGAKTPEAKKSQAGVAVSDITATQIKSLTFSEELTVKNVSKEAQEFRERLEYEALELKEGNAALVRSLKENFLRLTTTALVSLQSLEKSESATNIIRAAEEVSKHDGEFVLKVSLYCRTELGLRTLSNFLLAFASTDRQCQVHLSKYFNAITRLPSDWLEVAYLAKFINEKFGIGLSTLPAALRRVMVAKFPEFSEYQLAKHNKVVQGDKEDKDSRDMFSLKRLIRTLHISKPVGHVMSILGKRYPEDREDFSVSGLPGVFEEERAGKRMRLAIPETWETQVSKHGNKASVWEKLIDERKLPFMATIRNLRNLILANISEEHVQKVIKYITNETAVVNSKMFPHQFFTAFEVLNVLENSRNSKKPHGKRNAKEKKKVVLLTRKQRQVIGKFRSALDKVVAIASQYNIPPMNGVTLILCSTGTDMVGEVGSNSKKGLLPLEISTQDAGILLGLMALSAAEKGEMHLFIDKSVKVEPANESFLENVKHVKNNFGNMLSRSGSCQLSALVKSGVLFESLRDCTWIDNLVVLHGQPREDEEMKAWLTQYRQLVNPSLVYVNVNIAKTNAQSATIAPSAAPNDFYLSGFTEKVFHCLSKLDSGGQVGLVDRIDRRQGLFVSRPLTTPAAAASSDDTAPLHLRVFISSTFMDMHGERDLLNNFVFPELKRRARTLHMTVTPVDLRWGIPVDNHAFTDQVQNGRALVETCLKEIQSCQLFVGILGERYGWKPKKECLQQCKTVGELGVDLGEVSITEIEQQYAAMASPEENKGRAFFFLRRPLEKENIPEEMRGQFFNEDPEDEARLSKLKERIRKSGLEVIDNYNAGYGGVVNNKPIVTHLEDFGTKALDVLWNAVTNIYTETKAEKNKVNQERVNHEKFSKIHASEFVSRKNLIQELMTNVRSKPSGVIEVSGQEGVGVTSVLCKCHQLATKTLKNTIVIPYFASADPNQSGGEQLIRYIWRQICLSVGLQEDMPSAPGSLMSSFASLLQSLGSQFRYIIFIEGLEQGKTKNLNLDWIPRDLPPGIVFVISAVPFGPIKKQLCKRKNVTKIVVKPLDIKERREITRDILKQYGKSLNEQVFQDEVSMLINKRDGGNVSFLKILCHEVASYGLFEELPQKLESIGGTLNELLEQILIRVESEMGETLVKDTLSILAICSSYGITEEYLIKTLAMLSSSGDSIPQVQIAILLNSLEVFLKPTGGNLMKSKLLLKDGLFHKIISDRYLSVGRTWDRYSKALVQTFCHFYEEQVSTLSVDPLILGGLPHQLAKLGYTQHLIRLICTLSHTFFCAKAGVMHELIDLLSGELIDTKGMKDAFLSNQQVQQYRSFTQNYLKDFQEMPQLIFQHALNEPDDSDLHLEAKKVMATVPHCVLPEVICHITRKAQSNEQCLKQAVSGEVTTVIRGDEDANNEDFLAYGLSDGSVTITKTGWHKESLKLMGHSCAISTLLFVPNERTLISGDVEGFMSFWDLNSGTRLKSIKAHNKKVSGLSLSCDGMTFVSVSWDTNIKIWSVRQKSELSCITQNKKPLNCVVCHPFKEKLVTGSWDGKIKIWDATSLERKAVIRGHQASVQDLKITHDGKYIVSCDLDGFVKVFESSLGCLTSSFQSQSTAFKLEVERNGSEFNILLGCRNGNIQKWSVTPAKVRDIDLSQLKVMSININDNKLLSRSPMMISETSTVTAIASIFNGRAKLVGYETGEIQVVQFGLESEPIKSYFMKIRKGDPIRGFRQFSSTRNPHKDTLELYVYTSKQVLLVCLKDFNELNTMKELYETDDKIIGCEIVEAPSTLAVGTESEGITVLQKQGIGEDYYRKITNKTHAGGMKAFSVEANSRRIATLGIDDTLKVWQTSSFGTMTLTLLTSLNPISALKLISTDDEDYLLTSQEGGVLRLAELHSLGGGKLQLKDEKVFHHSKSAVQSLHGNSDYFVCVHTNREVSVWSLKGIEVTSMEIQDTSAMDFTETSEGCHLFTSIGERNLVVHNVFEATCQNTLSGHKDKITALVAAGNSMVISGSTDKSICRWKNEHMAHVTRIHEGKLISIRKELGKAICSSEEGTISIWDTCQNQVLMTVTVGLYEKIERLTSINTSTVSGTNILLVGGSSLGNVYVWWADLDGQSMELLTSFKVEGSITASDMMIEKTLRGMSVNICTGLSNGKVVQRKLNLPFKQGHGKIEEIGEISQFINCHSRVEVLALEPLRALKDKYYICVGFEFLGEPSPPRSFNWADECSISSSSIDSDWGHFTDGRWMTCFAQVEELSVFGLVSGNIVLIEGEASVHWDLRPKHNLKFHTGAVTSIEAIRFEDERFIITGGEDGYVRFWRVERPCVEVLKVGELRLGGSPVTAIKWFDECRQLVVGSKSGDVFIVKVAMFVH